MSCTRIIPDGVCELKGMNLIEEQERREEINEVLTRARTRRVNEHRLTLATIKLKYLTSNTLLVKATAIHGRTQ
ncbi:MAG: hypothetical protein AAB288_07035 [Acidobacteriota bacterium]